MGIILIILQVCSFLGRNLIPSHIKFTHTTNTLGTKEVTAEVHKDQGTLWLLLCVLGRACLLLSYYTFTVDAVLFSLEIEREY